MSYKEKLKEGLEIPNNLLVLKWSNQVDILADNKTLAFITHGGWNSVAESMLHAVPMITCGWSLDRDFNSLLIEEKEIGERVQTQEDFTVENLEEKLLKVINNKKYKENILKYSRLVKKMDGAGIIMEAIDLFYETGVENLVIEQIYTMHWIQFYNLDVWLFEVFLLLVIFFILFKIVKVCFVFVFSKNRKISEKSIKKD